MPVREINYNDLTFLPPCLEDYVCAEHPARYIRDLVDLSNLESLGFDTDFQPDGRPSYAAGTLLKLWLYGYYRKVRSTRGLQAYCSESLGALWLCGGKPPDHVTLWRFWNKNKAAIGSLFKHSVRVAVKAGLVELALLAVDGTTITAASSRRTGWNKKQLEKQLEKVEEYLKALETEISKSGADELERSLAAKSIGSALDRKKKIGEAISALKEQDVESMHPHEPDARVMNNEGRRQWAWNCQAAVDEKNQIVVAASVTSEAHDCHCLTRMIGEAVDNLDGEKPKLFAADSAYGKSEDEVKKANAAQCPFVTARPKDESSQFHRSKFEMNRETMELTCPLQYKLKHIASAQRSTGVVERFRCTDWKQCGAGCACFGKSKKGRTVEVSPLHEMMNNHRSQFTSAQRKLLMRRRLKTIEPVFARRKEQDKFRRFHFRGREKVEAQWQMVNLMHNLKILHAARIKHLRESALPKAAEELFPNAVDRGARSLAGALRFLRPLARLSGHSISSGSVLRYPSYSPGPQSSAAA